MYGSPYIIFDGNTFFSYVLQLYFTVKNLFGQNYSGISIFYEYLKISSFSLYCKGCKINNAENLFFTSFLNDLFLNDVIPLPPSQQQIQIPSQLSTHSSISEELTLSKFACTSTKIFLETQIIFSNIKQKSSSLYDIYMYIQD